MSERDRYRGMVAGVEAGKATLSYIVASDIYDLQEKAKALRLKQKR